jgi:hypothetical protein
MKGKAEKVLGIILALMSLGILTTKVSSQPSDLPEKRSTKQDQLVHTVQPRLAQNYGRLPLSFELNQGQTDARVRFLARGGGYTIFLTDDEAVLTLKRSSVVSGQLSVAPTGTRPGTSRWGERGLPGRLDPFGPFAAGAGRWPSLAQELQSLWPSLIPDLSQMFRDPYAGKDAMAVGPEFPPPQVMRMRLADGSAHARVVGLDELPGKSNYFIGNDPKKWRTNVPSYAQVKYEGVYPGVDLVYYGNQRQLEYDFVVAPGADPNQIKLSFAGADGMRVDAASGDLVLKVGDDELRFHKPAVSQPTVAAMSSSPSKPVAALSERRRRSETAATAELDGAFVLASNNQVAFRMAGYDPQRALVIDPVLIYSTYLGGSYYDLGYGIAVDAAGNAYVTGQTDSGDFPTANPLQPNNRASCGAPCSNAFVTKFNPTGSALVYSTYLGGSAGDLASGIAVDSSGNAYVTGATSSIDFPTANPFQGTCDVSPPPTGTGSCEDAFVAKLNPAGSELVYSTYLGGSHNDYGEGIAVDSSGNAYVTGVTSSDDFPTANPFQGAPAYFTDWTYAFVTKLNPTGSALVYSTYLGDGTEGTAIAVDAAGSAYVTGDTGWMYFPTTANSFQPSYGGNQDAFVTKFNPGGSALVYSTYLGGSETEYGQGIAVDSFGNAYVTGYTDSSDFPTANPIQGCAKCGASIPPYDAFVTKLDPTGSVLVYSTYLGGSGWDYGEGIAVDAAGNAYVTGNSGSTDFPTANPLQACSNNNAFVAQFNPTGSELVYSTCLGGAGGNSTWGYGIAADGAGNAYVTGVTNQNNFPVANPFQPNCDNCWSVAGDAFVAKISTSFTGPWVSLSALSLSFGSQYVCCAPIQTVTVTNGGTADLTISTVTMAGTNPSDFPKSADTCTGATVTPTNTCTVSATFTPSAPGSLSASLIFTDNASNTPQTVSLTGTGIVPVASVSPLSLTFGNQNLGTTSGSQPVTLSNTGNEALTIASIATSSANFGQNNNCPSSLAASGSCTINVTFSPTATGPLTGTLTITDNSNGVAGSTQIVALAGTGINAGAGLSPTSLSFGNQVIDTTSAIKTVTLTSTGTTNLSISTITITGTNASDFAANNCPASMAPKAKCTIKLTYTPTVLGAETASLTVTDNAANSPQTVALSGSGESPVVLSPTSLSFGNQAEGTTSTAKTVTLTNNLSTALAVSSVTTSGDFGQNNTCGTSVPAKGKCTISVTFMPSIIGGETGTLTVTDGTSNSQQTVALTGTGVAPVTLAPTTLAFGSVVEGNSSAGKVITVTNVQNVALTGINVSTTSTDYTLTNGCGASLAAGQKCTITVTFTPSVIGTDNATVNIFDSAANSPQTAALMGTGTTPVTLTPPSATYTSQTVGTTSAAKAFTLTSSLTATLNNMVIGTTGDFAVSTTTCGTSLASKGKCTINVVFKPTATGTRSGTLSVNDSAGNSPQTSQLTGTGK